VLKSLIDCGASNWMVIGVLDGNAVPASKLATSVSEDLRLDPESPSTALKHDISIGSLKEPAQRLRQRLP